MTRKSELHCHDMPGRPTPWWQLVTLAVLSFTLVSLLIGCDHELEPAEVTPTTCRDGVFAICNCRADYDACTEEEIVATMASCLEGTSKAPVCAADFADFEGQLVACEMVAECLPAVVP